MNLTIPKRDLVGALSTVVGSADKRAVMPSLACVRIEAKGDTVTLQTTDLKHAQTRTLKAEIAKSGSFALPAHPLLDRVKAMPDGPIVITVNDASATLKAAGSARKYVLRGMPAADFPPMPALDDGAPTSAISTATLARLLTTTINAISTDETRPHLNALLVEWEGDTIRAVATDGHRLHLAETKVEGQGSLTMLVPLTAVQLVKKLCEEGEEITIAQSGASAFFRVGDVTLATKLVDAQFPPYRQVIPKSSIRHVTVSARSLRDAVRAVSVASHERTGGVKLAFSEGSTLTLTAESPDGGESEDQVTLDSVWSGEGLTIAFAGRYLENACEACGDGVITVGLNGDLDPMLIQLDESSFTIMPMRS